MRAVRATHGSPPAALGPGDRSPGTRIINRRGVRGPTPIGWFPHTSIEVRGYPRQVVIVSLGDLVMDVRIVPQGPLEPDDDTPASITIGGGGQAANFCAWSAALGEPARLVTRVGDDDTGRRLVADLESRGVEVRAVWAAEPTGVIAVLVGLDGRRTMATQRGASVGLRPDDLREAWFRDATLLHVPAYSLFVEPIASATRAAITVVREAGGMLAIDLSSAAGLRAFGPARMAYVLARMKPEVLFATEAEAATLAVPLEGLAQVAVLDGRLRVGLGDIDLERIASGSVKVSSRDLGPAIARRAAGATTVAATMRIAAMAGVRFMATGGIGGIHRGHPEDESADLGELAQTPVAVFCAGAKIILDLRLTLERLETLSVPVLGYGVDEFPAFYSRRSGCRVGARVDGVDDCARAF